MYLKTLTVRGFKSFASTTIFEFEPGVTAVVGPNGSGKSNVVDALAWVMGEQGAKTLRGGKMEDVIFAGTTGRAALGRAQVSLTIDNSDGALPIEYSEVTITRTLFRSGGSEYAINGSPARLLDIQELLSDSGLGREMHVIVGQGQLDRILRATPEERRGFVEEAAGILKHRRRKEKTLRKLDSMQANLARLEDLTGEISKQLKPLGKQADTARRAKTVQATVRDAKARLLADDLFSLLDASQKSEAEQAELSKASQKATSEAEDAENNLAKLQARAGELVPAVGRSREAWYALSRLLERYRGLTSLAEERRRLLGSPADEQRAGVDPDELDARATKAKTDAAQAQDEAARCEAQLAEVSERRRSAEAKQKREDERLTAQLRAVADRREGLARLAGEVGTARQRVESAEGACTRARDALQSAYARLDTVTQQLGQARVAAAEASTKTSAPVAQVAELRQDVSAAKDQLRVARRRLSPLAEKRAGLQARVATLSESLPGDLGTGALLQGHDQGLVGVLADRLTVRPGMEAAVAAGLVGAQSALVVEDAALSMEIALEAASGVEGSVWLLNRLSGPGVVPQGELPPGASALTDFVECDADDSRLVDALLSGVVVVEDDRSAASIAASGEWVAVTVEGHRWDQHSLRLGSRGIAALEHKAHLEAAQNELAMASKDEADAKRRLEHLEPQSIRLQHLLASAERESKNVTEASRHANTEVRRLESMAHQAEAETQRAQNELERSQTSVREATTSLASLAARMETAQAMPTDAEPSTEARDQAMRLAESLRSEEIEARLDLRQAQDSFQRLNDRVNGLLRAAKRERQAQRDAQARARRRAQRAAAAERVSTLAHLIEKKLLVTLDKAKAYLEANEAIQRKLNSEVESSRAKVARSKAELQRLDQASHEIEVFAAERSARLESLHERILDEVGMTPEYLVAHFGPDQPVPAEPDPTDRWAALHMEVDEFGDPIHGLRYVRAEQEKRLKRAEKDLAALGRINPLALEEFAALEERHTYLSGQLEDLKSSRTDLLDLVRQVDERVKEVFTSAYEDTAVEFKRIFARLFPGGVGELVLTDPADMLTTGIDVHARPAGKKVKRLSLLSGGERSLTAIAMLVAIFTARPSPFYVMDEVEAALDERNLSRLLDVFSELREHSQLIIITHQKHTMDIADALYGVSMRGDGVTKVISQHIEKWEKAVEMP